MSETIYAFATPEGRSAIAVLRLSGPGCSKIMEQMLDRAISPRSARLVKVRHPSTRELLDQAIAIWNPGPASFTGEDCLELHLHGSRAVRKAVMHALGDLDGCRPAEAGEFTRRAFVNGKTNLSRLEGLADLLSAETESQRRQAMAVMDGGVEQVVAVWRGDLLEAMALLEASIDFSDESDVPDDVAAKVDTLIGGLRSCVQRHLDIMSSGEVVRSGFKVVIAGPPNAGKSSLLNALARRDVAIVTDVPGTTRDLLEVSLELDGHLVILIDSAGIRETQDVVEKLGIERAKGAIEDADLVIWLSETSGANCDIDLTHMAAPCLVVNSKCDLWNNVLRAASCSLSISTKTGEGISSLLQEIARRVGSTFPSAESAIFAHERHRMMMKQLLSQLEDFERDFGNGDPEIVCEHLRLALRCLGRLVGTVHVEDVLGAIFSRFCIGK